MHNGLSTENAAHELSLGTKDEDMKLAHGKLNLEFDWILYICE